LNFGLYKNRELEWNVKDKDTPNREMDAGCAVFDAGYRAEEFKLMLRRSLSCGSISEEAGRLVLLCYIIIAKYFIRISKGCNFN
jgi:hypothetical protein